MTTTSLPCTRCKGTGTREDILRCGATKACHYCEGSGVFHAPVLAWYIEQLTKPVKGTDRRVLKKSVPTIARHPKWPARRSREADRLAYVHRMVAFHAGWDVRPPMIASMDVEGDPFEPLLDALARELVANLLGRSSIGHGRWRGALTGVYGEAGPGVVGTGTEGGPEFLTGAERS